MSRTIINGQTIAEHAQRLGINPTTIVRRIARGHSPEDACAAPSHGLARQSTPRPPDALDEVIWCERLGPDGPTATLAAIGRRFGVTRSAVQQREAKMRAMSAKEDSDG